VGIFAIAVGTALLSQYLASVRDPGWFHAVAQDVSGTCQDSATQWMVVICLAAYVSSFGFVELGLLSEAGSNRRQWRGLVRSFRTLDVWLLALLSVTLLGYFLGYESTSASTDIVVLIGGIVFGKAATGWLWSRSVAVREVPNIQWLVGTLVLVLTGLAFWQAHFNRSFAYIKFGRWSGPWDNPNEYGMLMGVGIVLVAGEVVQSLFSAERGSVFATLRHDKVRSAESAVENPKASVHSQRLGVHSPQSTVHSRKSGWKKRLWVLLYSVAVIVCGIGLVKSYSRGAWLATACGIIYLMWRGVRSANVSPGNPEHHLTPALSPTPWRRGRRSHAVSWAGRNWRVLPVIGVSLAVLGFWQFRFTEWRPARRAFSMANANDFSWRNRVTAWKGAIRMMAHRPVRKKRGPKGGRVKKEE